MSWKKHFKPVTVDGHGSHSPLGSGGRPGPAKTNYSSFLPDVYAGTPNRVDRYMQYDTMDMDSEVNAALDIIAEFCTQKDKENETPFHTSFRGQPTSTEVKLIKDCLQKWCKQQQFETRIFRIIRNTFKYGDCFFLRDPETKKWLYVDPVKVSKIIANESEGKIPEQYVIRDINFNFKNLVAVTPHGTTNTSPSGTSSYSSGGSLARGMVGDTARATGTRFQNANNEIAVDAKDVVHISLSEGLDSNFPFGNSLLESVFKVYKQKELLEDAVIIYRVQRAPERRIFYVDVGNMPAHMAMGFVERVKNEIQQRRIPSSNGGVSSVDSSYNPISQNEDYFLPKTSEGRGSSIETLPGGCLEMSTLVPLIDGRTLSLTEITVEYKAGKVNHAYSANPETGEITTGIISWAGVTQESAIVMKLTISTGDTLICTPDHKFPIIGNGDVRADELVIGEVFIPHQLSFSDVTLTNIEYLDEQIQVGTLTIDEFEEEHNYHNFALSIGFISKNSNLGEITDLRFFTNKLFRALRIPASYLPTGVEESSNTVADGKVGTAYIQEFRFNEYCKRLQNLLVQTFDLEFKLWLYSQGINIDSSLFELKFNEPQNFAAYRQSELDTARVNIFAQLQEIPYLSKRFAMKRFLGMTQEEITENEAMWREENGHKLESLVDGAGELRSAGISPSGIASDLGTQDEMAPPDGPGGPDGSTGGADVAPGAAGGGAPGPTGGPMGM